MTDGKGAGLSDMVLEELASGKIPGLTVSGGGTLCECAAICLESAQHSPGVPLAVNGSFSRSFRLLWTPSSDQAKRCWWDLHEATERGAAGISILATVRLTPYTVVLRARKGEFFDYWLGDKDDPGPLFQKKARLEVSGILSPHKTVASRMQAKRAQTDRAPAGLPMFISVVDFNAPVAQVVQR